MRASLRGRSAPRPGCSLTDRRQQTLGAGGLVVDRAADARLDLVAVALQGRLDRALVLARFALNPIAGLASFGGRFAAGRGAATLGALDGFAQLRAVGLELFLGAGAAGPRVDQIGDPVADAEDDAHRHVDGG